MSQDARREEENNTQRRARILGLTYSDTSQNVSKVLYKDLLTVAELYDLRVIPILVGDHAVTFGVTNTTSQQTMAALRQRFLDHRINFSLISDMGYREYMHLYDPPKQVIYQDISLSQAGSSEQIKSMSVILDQVKADDMLGYLVQQAHQLNASDIHLETQRDHARIRFRIDGVLHRVAELDASKYRNLISAIASAGNVSTAANDAQQGHISRQVSLADGRVVDVNVRLETVPTVNGMDVVMRLFNMNADMYTLDRLGLSGGERAVVDDIIAKPSGLVLVVGPTGSGKTTTLYSMLQSLNSEERKIITIEDPVEYQFPGITQISITSQNSTEKNFAEKLRAVLRLDPDIVMVGEIRDMDTAKTALQAALTGHLVLATFHAASAAAALTRMNEIIGQNPLFVSAIRLVMAQRLVRKLDDSTKIAYQADESTRQKLRTVFESLPHGVPWPELDNLQLFSAGITPDNPYGYKGQIALREQFLMTGEIRTLLEQAQTGLSSQQIELAAINSGMMTMLQAGILSVAAGNTTLEEVYRVLG
ncbi:MAG: type IV-A pilus assembly ATPase PilB [Candidatus Saccharimonadales bacterium]